MGRSQGLVQKDFQEHLYTSIVVFPDLFCPTPSPSSAVKAPENTEEDPDVPEPSDGDIEKGQSYYLYIPSIGAVTKNNLQDLRSVQVLSDNLHCVIIQHLPTPIRVRLMELCCIRKYWSILCQLQHCFVNRNSVVAVHLALFLE